MVTDRNPSHVTNSYLPPLMWTIMEVMLIEPEEVSLG